MRMVDIITKKRDGGILTREEISFFVNGYVENKIPDYQISALMMAILFKGMNKEEIVNLTDIMEHSGDTMDLSKIKIAQKYERKLFLHIRTVRILFDRILYRYARVIQ